MTANKKLVNSVILGSVSLISGTLILLIISEDHQNTIATLPTGGNISLEEPFFIERYSNSTIQPQPPGTTFNTTGFGLGIFNGTTEVQTEANATITFRNSQTIFLEGRARYTNNAGDKASYLFLELGKINPIDITYSGRGIAIFDEKATGMLKTLSDIVAIYKSVIDANGNATVYYYHWN
jgi:hypothetical protein